MRWDWLCGHSCRPMAATGVLPLSPSAPHRHHHHAEAVTSPLLSCSWSDPTDSADRTAGSWNPDKSGRTRSHRRRGPRPLPPPRLPPDIPTAPVAADQDSVENHETPSLVGAFLDRRFHPAVGWSFHLVHVLGSCPSGLLLDHVRLLC